MLVPSLRNRLISALWVPVNMVPKYQKGAESAMRTIQLTLTPTDVRALEAWAERWVLADLSGLHAKEPYEAVLWKVLIALKEQPLEQ